MENKYNIYPGNADPQGNQSQWYASYRQEKNTKNLHCITEYYMQNFTKMYATMQAITDNYMRMYLHVYRHASVNGSIYPA